MAVKLVITVEVVDAWHPEGEPEKDFVAMSINEALPSFNALVASSDLWSRYCVGLLGVGDTYGRSKYFETGQHYIILGSSAEASKNEYQVMKVTIATEMGQTVKQVTTGEVNDQQYYVIGFGVNADDPGIDGAISPNETPDVTPGEHKDSTPGWPIDPEMFKDMMNFMMQTMMMMAMMQVMMSMMGGMTQAFSTVW